MAATDKVRKAVPEDLPEISTALSRAFFDDPQIAWAIPDEDRRQRVVAEFFTLYAKAFLRHDQTYTSGGDVVAAALWAPPGAAPISDEDAEELGQRMEELAGPDAPRFLGLAKLIRRPPPARVLLVPPVHGRRPRLAGPGHRLGLDGAGAGAL